MPSPYPSPRFNNVTIDGALTTASITVNLLTASGVTGSWVPVVTGNYTWTTTGTWQFASVTLEWSGDGGTTSQSLGVAQFADTDIWADLQLQAGHVRVVVTYVTGSAPSLTSNLVGYV